jgi:hypothetical protein
VPAGDRGRVYLVERHVESKAALDELVAHLRCRQPAPRRTGGPVPCGRDARRGPRMTLHLTRSAGPRLRRARRHWEAA